MEFSENEKIILNHEKKTIEIINNRILINDANNFILDIGAPNVLFNNKLNLYRELIVDSLQIGSLERFDGTKIKNMLYVIDTLNTSFYKMNNAVFRGINNLIDPCLNSNGLLGVETFFGEIILINFQNNFIQSLDANMLYNNKKKFTEIKVADFDNYYFKINTTINNVKMKLMLDTGTPSDIILSFSNFNKIKKNKDSVNTFYTIKNNKLDSILSINSFLSINTFKDSVIVKTKKKVKHNLLGVGFMKNYNWILDYHNGKVYVQKFQNNELIIKNRHVKIKNNNLIISLLNKKIDQNSLGKIISSVNDTLINSSNICSFKNKLNTKNEWTNLQIKFKQ